MVQLYEYKHSLPTKTEDVILLPDSPQAFVLRPDSVGKYPYLLVPKKRFGYRTNHAGLRDRDRGEKIKPGTRTLVIGDSYIFGYAVYEEEAFPQVAEHLLHARGHVDLEVINAGIPGYNTLQERYLLESLMPELKPDLVVLGYVMNDAEPQSVVPPSPRQIYRHAWSWLWEDLKDRANAMCFDKRPVLGVRKSLYSEEYLNGFQPESPKWRDSKDALREIKAICDRSHVPLLVLILPDFTALFDSSYAFAKIHRAVANWGVEFGIPTFDLLTAVFHDQDHVAYQVEGDGHPNALAHREIAEFLANRILEVLSPDDRAGAAKGSISVR